MSEIKNHRQRRMSVSAPKLEPVEQPIEQQQRLRRGSISVPKIDIEDAPKPVPRVHFEVPMSKSLPPAPASSPIEVPKTGLNSIKTTIDDHDKQFKDFNRIIIDLRSVIHKYEMEIKELQKDNRQRDELIKKYELRYNEIEKQINDIWNN